MFFNIFLWCKFNNFCSCISLGYLIFRLKNKKVKNFANFPKDENVFFSCQTQKFGQISIDFAAKFLIRFIFISNNLLEFGQILIDFSGKFLIKFIFIKYYKIITLKTSPKAPSPSFPTRSQCVAGSTFRFTWINSNLICMTLHFNTQYWLELITLLSK